MYQIDVLDKGFVRLDSYSKDADLSVINSARVSFSKKSYEIDDAGEKLIGFLMREHHGTPFEHNLFTFHVKCPIFVAREWFRHRIGSFNEMSMRYYQPDLEFYLPAAEDFRTQVGKPGSYSFEPIDNSEGVNDYYANKINEVYRLAEETYEFLLAKDVAKELARIVLPVGVYTEFYWTVNARSVLNFLSLRNDSNAQLEIRRFAEGVEDLFADKMPITHRAFVMNGRIAI